MDTSIKLSSPTVHSNDLSDTSGGSKSDAAAFQQILAQEQKLYDQKATGSTTQMDIAVRPANPSDSMSAVMNHGAQLSAEFAERSGAMKNALKRSDMGDPMATAKLSAYALELEETLVRSKFATAAANGLQKSVNQLVKTQG